MKSSLVRFGHVPSDGLHGELYGAIVAMTDDEQCHEPYYFAIRLQK